jgi:osmotically inducible protein OsmC
MKRKAQAQWKGSLKDGKGAMKTGSGACKGKYSFSSRFEDGKGTNPEELIGAAHAGCFSMQFSALLAEAGHPPESVTTEAEVTVEPQGEGFAITSIVLNTEGKVPGIEENAFQKTANKAKETCPVSKALAGVNITLKAKLVQD